MRQKQLEKLLEEGRQKRQQQLEEEQKKREAVRQQELLARQAAGSSPTAIDGSSSNIVEKGASAGALAVVEEEDKMLAADKSGELEAGEEDEEADAMTAESTAITMKIVKGKSGAGHRCSSERGPLQSAFTPSLNAPLSFHPMPPSRRATSTGQAAQGDHASDRADARVAGLRCPRHFRDGSAAHALP